MSGSRARTLAGIALWDAPIYWRAWRAGGEAWRAIRNRAERLEPAPDGRGYRCLWQWTSELHAPRHVPALGRWLMRRALAAHPIGLADAPQAEPGGKPELSFLIGHRGMARLPHLLTTLRSIAAQREVAVECIVIEQDVASQLRPHLPPWVRLVHTPPPAPDMPYCRAWAFNIGARHARADVLVLHDNDMPVPTDYAAWILARCAQGYEVVNPKRFIFYLSEAHTRAVFEHTADWLGAAPDAIVQNLEGGGSVAITRAAYEAIGGLDERFIGWGGEDNEFWERAQTRRVWPWAGLPLVHLWHAAQLGKHDATYPTALHYRALARIDPRERIERLRTVPQGCMQGPAGWGAYISADAHRAY
ncbi:MAG: glycosyltransferase family 2 protein [Casimicrobiaceae bacterium]